MQKRVIGLLMIFGFIILSLNFISAASCDVRLRTQCQTDPWDNIVIGISAATNAHGENATDGTYPYVLCCDFQGNRGGTGTNKIIGLSSITNAHAEIPSLSNYPVNVYYTSVKDCRNTTSNCALDEIGILSLSAPTNAHLGTFDTYSTKICCKYTGSPILTCDLTNAFWSKNGVDPLTESVMEGIEVKLVVKGDNCGNDQTSVSFEVREDDEGPATNQPAMATFNDNKAIGTWAAEWTDDGFLQGDPEYYFIATVISQSESVTSNDPMLKVTEQEGDWCTTNNINLCGDYPDSIVCNSDLCNVSGNTPPTGVNCDDPLANCDCSWNTGTSTCEFVSTSGALCGNNVIDAGEHCDGIEWGNFISTDCNKFDAFTGGNLLCIECKFSTVNCTGGNGFGSCGNNIVNRGETCDGTNFGPVITGCQDFNEFNNTGTLSCNNCQFNTSLCIGGLGWDIAKPSGTCKYTTSTDDDCSDGYLSYNWTATWEGTGEKPSWCQDGSRVYKCPAQAKLPFFNIYSLIGAIVLIALIYFLLVLKKKKMKLKKRVGSKRKRKR